MQKDRRNNKNNNKNITHASAISYTYIISTFGSLMCIYLVLYLLHELTFVFFLFFLIILFFTAVLQSPRHSFKV